MKNYKNLLTSTIKQFCLIFKTFFISLIFFFGPEFGPQTDIRIYMYVMKNPLDTALTCYTVKLKHVFKLFKKRAYLNFISRAFEISFGMWWNP